MEVVAFAKEVPSTPIHLANGRKVIFDSTDGVTGYTISADPGIITQLDNCIRNGIGGVRRATIQEYEEFSKKKLPTGLNRPKQWREELSPSNINTAGVLAAAAVRPTIEAGPVAPAPAPAAPVAAAEPQKPFKPRTAKRSKA